MCLTILWDWCLKSYVTQHNCNKISLFETFLNFSIQNDNNRINTNYYNLIKTDHSSNSKKVGVCIYYKEHIPFIEQDDICTLNNCLVTEINLQNKNVF